MRFGNELDEVVEFLECDLCPSVTRETIAALIQRAATVGLLEERKAAADHMRYLSRGLPENLRVWLEDEALRVETGDYRDG